MTSIPDLSGAAGAVALRVFAYPIAMTLVTPGALGADGTATPGTETVTVVRGVITDHQHRQQPWPKDALTLHLIDCEVTDICAACRFEASCGPFEGQAFELVAGEGGGAVWRRHGVGGVISFAIRPSCHA